MSGNRVSDNPGPIEVEFKLVLVDEEQRQRLLETLRRPGAGPGAPVRQENHFFDTSEGALRRTRHVLRARREGADWTLTLKGPPLMNTGTNTGTGLEQRAEEELPITAAEAAAIVGGRSSALAPFLESPSPLARRALALVAGHDLIGLGHFVNERTRLGADEVVPELGVGVELDRTRFPGDREDLELEVEIPTSTDATRVERVLRTLLERARIPWIPAESKAVRFFRILDGMSRPRGGHR